MLEIDEEHREEFETIREALKNKGMVWLFEQIEEHRKVSDTVKITPIIDNQNGHVLRNTTEELLIRQGYVLALDWVLWLANSYKDYESK